jgi:hypothetical protein
MKGAPEGKMENIAQSTQLGVGYPDAFSGAATTLVPVG